MKIKKGDKLPETELFYLDQNNDVRKINTLDLCKGKIIILGMPVIQTAGRVGRTHAPRALNFAWTYRTLTGLAPEGCCSLTV